MVDGAFTAKTKALGYNSQFWYPRRGGINQIAFAFLKHINSVKTSHKVIGIDLEKKKVFFKNKKTVDFTHLISTIPLIELKNIIINKTPRDIKEAFSKLKYISIYNLNLGIDRARISDKHWIYYPEEKFSFFRIGFPMNFSNDVTPAGKSSIYIEVSYSKFKPLAKEKMDDVIISDLIAAQIINKRDRIVTKQTNDIKYGYILYDHNYRKATNKLNSFLSKYNIFLAGRYGRWSYMSMEDAVLDGKIIVDKLN